MITIAELSALLEQYSKHEWVARRICLSVGSIKALDGKIAQLSPDLTVVESENEAVWFARRSLPDREAWELRRLSGSPFALVIMIEDSLDAAEREELLRETERQMFDGTHTEPTSH